MAEYAMPKVGDVIAGKYRLEKVAGEGGMGVVYAAEHLVLKQRVAVKVLLPDAATSEHVVERFAREAQANARIPSEHVARVMDAGSTATGAPFLVMEYLEGCDLAELLEIEDTLPVTDVVDYMMQALEALAHAHAVGIVHRDLKPANLFLACRADGGNVIKMLDFGISKAMTSRPEQKVLTGQAVLGSPVYMSPEQLRNAKDIDARADIWSIGIVAYELLSGRPPFDGDGVGEIFAAILEKTAEPLHEKNDRVPPGLSDVIAKCLERKPEDRWQDTAALAAALKPFGSGNWNSVVDRAEQILARAKLLKRPETPSDARLVVAALAEVARRARTHGGAPSSSRMATARETAPEMPPAAKKSWPLSSSRFIGVAAALAVAIGVVALVSMLRPGQVPVVAASHAPVTAAALATVPNAAGTAQATAVKPPPENEESPPMVMELPESPGRTGPQRSQNAKPGKPQRPKFLNSRE